MSNEGLFTAVAVGWVVGIAIGYTLIGLFILIEGIVNFIADVRESGSNNVTTTWAEQAAAYEKHKEDSNE